MKKQKKGEMLIRQMKTQNYENFDVLKYLVGHPNHSTAAYYASYSASSLSKSQSDFESQKEDRACESDIELKHS